jgi:hypothetical protein
MKTETLSTNAPGGELAAGPRFRWNTRHRVDAAFEGRGNS